MNTSVPPNPPPPKHTLKNHMSWCILCIVCFNKAKAVAGAWLVKACCVLAESQAAGKCQGNHTQHSEGSAHSWSEAEVERRVEKKKKHNTKRKRKRETCKNIALKATQLTPAVTASPVSRRLSLSLCFISMVSDSSGKYGILRREGKHKQNPTGIPINL